MTNYTDLLRKLNELNAVNEASLRKAAEKGDLDKVKHIIKTTNNYDLLKSKDDNGDTPLILAAKAGHTRTVKYFIEKTESSLLPEIINTQNNDDRNALMIAVLKGRTHAVKQILKSRMVSLEAVDYFDNTVIMLAARKGHLKILQLLLEEAKKQINLKSSNPQKKARMKSALLNTVNSRGNNALMLAARNGHIDVVMELASSTNIFTKNNQDKDAYTIAVENDHHDISRFLFKKMHKKESTKNPATAASTQTFYDVSTMPVLFTANDFGSTHCDTSVNCDTSVHCDAGFF